MPKRASCLRRHFGSRRRERPQDLSTRRPRSPAIEPVSGFLGRRRAANIRCRVELWSRWITSGQASDGRDRPLRSELPTLRLVDGSTFQRAAAPGAPTVGATTPALAAGACSAEIPVLSSAPTRTLQRLRSVVYSKRSPTTRSLSGTRSQRARLNVVALLLDIK